MTTDNQTRELALELAERDEEAIPPDDLALMTSEYHFAITLSKELGIPRRLLLMTLPSSDWTHYRAAALIEAAQGQLIDRIART
jgi:hypothetical protein